MRGTGEERSKSRFTWKITRESEIKEAKAGSRFLQVVVGSSRHGEIDERFRHNIAEFFFFFIFYSIFSISLFDFPHGKEEKSREGEREREREELEGLITIGGIRSRVTKKVSQHASLMTREKSSKKKKKYIVPIRPDLIT